MQQKTPSFLMRHRAMILQALLMTAVWLTLSGKFEPIYIFWGTVSIIFVIWLTHRMHHIPVAKGEPRSSTYIIIPRLLLYLAWLVWQIVQSGFYVAYLVLHPKMPIHPTLVRFTSRQPNTYAKVILGNSITLTPGTLTLNITEDRFTVHALTHETANDLTSGDMEARVARLYLRDFDRGDMCRDVELITSDLRD